MMFMKYDISIIGSSIIGRSNRTTLVKSVADRLNISKDDRIGFYVHHDLVYFVNESKTDYEPYGSVKVYTCLVDVDHRITIPHFIMECFRLKIGDHIDFISDNRNNYIYLKKSGVSE